VTIIHTLLHYILPLALVGTAFALARKRTDGASRYCLLGFLGIVFGTTLTYLVLNTLRFEGILADKSYRNFTSTASAFFVVVNIASLALLVAYTALLGKLEAGPTGYGGWLKFYVVIYLYVAPIAVVVSGIYLAPSILRIAGPYAGFASLLGVQYAAVLAVTALGAYAALRLKRTDAVGLRLTRLYLWLLLTIPLAGLTLATLIEVPDAVRSDFHEMQLLDLMKAFIFFLVWVSYFRISRRVRNTFTPGSATPSG
jgi:hypothetical protein